MQVVLFNSEAVTKSISRKLGSLKSRDFKVKYDFSKENMSNEKISQINNLIRRKREYKDIFGSIQDSHYSAELLGISSLSREYGLNIDFSNNLDIILSCICGCSPYSVRTIKNYDIISRSLLSMNLRNFNIPLSSFLGLSDELDKYIVSKLQQNSDIYAMQSILEDILKTMTSIVCYVGFYLEDTQLGCTVRSIDGCNLLLQSSMPIEFSTLELMTRDMLYSSRVNCFIIDNKNNRRRLG